MPQMSKLPFLLMSAVLLMFFLLWIVKVWFNNNEKKSGKSLSGFKMGSKNWPLNYFW